MHAVIANPKTVALLGLRETEGARLIFARAADAPGDMNELMREASTALEGRGGGRPDMAQGGGRNVSKLPEVIEAAASKLTTS